VAAPIDTSTNTIKPNTVDRGSDFFFCRGAEGGVPTAPTELTEFVGGTGVDVGATVPEATGADGGFCWLKTGVFMWIFGEVGMSFFSRLKFTNRQHFFKRLINDRGNTPYKSIEKKRRKNRFTVDQK
jgi:hypothetical protein